MWRRKDEMAKGTCHVNCKSTFWNATSWVLGLKEIVTKCGDKIRTLSSAHLKPLLDSWNGENKSNYLMKSARRWLMTKRKLIHYLLKGTEETSGNESLKRPGQQCNANYREIGSIFLKAKPFGVTYWTICYSGWSKRLYVKQRWPIKFRNIYKLVARQDWRHSK